MGFVICCLLVGWWACYLIEFSDLIYFAEVVVYWYGFSFVDFGVGLAWFN